MHELNNRLYRLYIATNKINQYKYVGITSMSIKSRAYAHRYEAALGGTSAFKLAIRQYGIESFIFEEMLSNLTMNEAILAEKEYIVKYRTFIGFDDCQGYNSSLGGEGVRYVNNESNWIVQFDKSGKFIEIHKSARAAEGNTGINRVGILNACDGKAVSCGGYLWRRYRDIEKLELPGEEVGRDRVIKSVTRFGLDGKNLGSFDSLKEAADASKCEASTIAKVCRGKLKSTGGFQWRYGVITGNIEPIAIKNAKSRQVKVMDTAGNVIGEFNSVAETAMKIGVSVGYVSRAISTGDPIKGMYFEATDYNHKREVVQIDFDGQEVAIYSSSSEASRVCGIDRAAIYNCCVGKAKTAGGYQWRYARE